MANRGWNKNFFFKALALLLSPLLLLIVLELVFRLFFHHTPLGRLLRYDDRMGWFNQENLTGSFYSRNGSRSFHFNQYGFRNNDFSLEDNSHEPRVLLLGDSFTVGLEVDWENTFGVVLEKKLRTFSPSSPPLVINAGVRGWGTDQELLFVKKWIAKIRPQLVILQACDNDLNDIMTVMLNKGMYYKPKFLLSENGVLKLVGTPTPKIDPTFLYRLNHRSCFFHYLNNRSIRFRRAGAWFKEKPISPKEDYVADSAQLFVELLREIRLQVENEHGEFFLFFIDDPHRYGQLLAEYGQTRADFGRHMVELLDRTGIPWLSFSPEGDLIITGDGHLNEAGHARLAEILYSKAAQRLTNKH